MEYYLMHKNEAVTICEMDPKGTMHAFAPKYRNPELAPIGFRAYDDHIQRWWKNRQVPSRQGRVEKFLKEKGFDEPSEYLLKNLGLSLTDYYWIKPIDSALKWEDVNLFDNDFKENLMQPVSKGERSVDSSCTPNSSLKGELEKTWLIRRNKRVLVKGNHGSSSAESINEVIATKFHDSQGYDNHVDYKLIHIKDKPYDYGCYSEAFTNNERELVSAYDLLTSEKPALGLSEYERLIEIANRQGLDSDQLRADLEYQIVSDYVLSNVDRHMDNIGFIRDSASLKLIRMAPIFDTGRAFGGSNITPYTNEEIDNIEVNSFEDKESKLLDLVKDKKRIDMSKLLPENKIRELYEKDSKMRKGQIDAVIRLYLAKIDRLEKQIHSL